MALPFLRLSCCSRGAGLVSLALGCVSVLAACGVVADVALPNGRWALQSIRDRPLPGDTTRVGAYVLAETLTVRTNPAALLVVRTMLERDMYNARRVSVDSETVSVTGSMGCTGYRVGDSKAERERRETLRESGRQLGVYFGDRNSAFPVDLDVVGDSIIVHPAHCGGAGPTRVYVRVGGE